MIKETTIPSNIDDSYFKLTGSLSHESSSYFNSTINACNMMEKNRENQWLPQLPRDSSYKTVRITNSQV